MSHNPDLYPQLSSYRTFIQTCAVRYTWPAVCSYDVRNRGKHSMHRSFDFNVIDNDIYITTMDSSTARQNVRNCSRCKSIWHVIKDCPFAEAGTLAPGTRQQTTSSPNQRPTSAGNSRNTSQQVCFNWNAGRCVPPCVRRHVCDGCGGPDPRPRCAYCNCGNSTFGAKPKQPQPQGPQQQQFTPTSGIQPSQGRMG